MKKAAADKKLNARHKQAQGKDKIVAPVAPSSAQLDKFVQIYPQLDDISPATIRKAWFAMAHMMLPAGSTVADIGCGSGAMTYAMATLNPDLQFMGLDLDEEKIAKAKDSYQLPNLEFRCGDITGKSDIAPESLDGIINAFIMHDICAQNGANERLLTLTLERQMDLLKPEGIAFIRDYALQQPGDSFVLIELTDEPSRGQDIALLSDADLLVWYAEHARPHENDSCTGFFLEELPPRLPKTRLFRLPYKWAYEFILRRDDRDRFKQNLHRDFSLSTESDLRRILKSLGARVLYTAPHWNDSLIREQYERRFRLYDEEGAIIGHPPTSFIAVAQKVGARKSLNLRERRPSQSTQNKILINAMRNDRNGKIIDIATRNLDVTDIIPYRVTGEGQLNIFIHDGLPRGIVNTVPRKGRYIDGKYWSGHMAEAIAVPTETLPETDSPPKNTALFARDYLGLKPAIDSVLEQGPSYYPAPDSIDECVNTRYLRVAERGDNAPIAPKKVMDDIDGFTTAGTIKEISAQRVLDAIAAGFIPNARLELQILNLFERLGIEAQTWDECPLTFTECDPEENFDAQDFARLKAAPDTRYKKSRGTAGKLRAVQSVFVDEGWIDGAPAGLAARDLEFIISEDDTVNKAVILPLTKQAGQIMVGLETDHLPVPQRHEGNGIMARAPSVILPKEITTIQQAKKFIADSFSVPVENVWRLGEAYFCHASLTPLRIFPFAVATSGSKSNPLSGPVQFAPMRFIWRIYNNFLWKSDMITMLTITRVTRRMGQDSDMSLKNDLGREMMAIKHTPAVTSSSSISGLGGSSTSSGDKGSDGNRKLAVK